MLRDERLLGWLLLLPSVVFLAAVFLWPLGEAFVLAFTRGGTWTLDHFREMAEDINFADALRNTLALTAVVVPLQLALALALALLLGRLGPGRDVFLYVWTIPLGISDLAAGIIWLAILGERGYLNSFLHALGLVDGPVLWLSYETPTALFVSVVVAELWRATAIVLVILVAGLQLVPREYGEAAEVFGAGPWQRLWRVTLPLLRPSIQTALILRTILALEVFAVVLALGGHDLPVLAGEAFAWQYEYRNPHIAAAYAVLILAISVAATWLYLRLLRVREEMLP